MQQERLQKIIAHAGVSSRREAEAMIREGRVTLNGRVVTELGTRADPDRDHIKVDGKLITHAEPHRYILLYKPREVMTTVEDPQGRRTVIDLVRGIRERIYPVGRLDFHSEGLVLLTNDGELAFKVSHPTHGSVKTYSVKVRGVPDERMVDKLRRGITIDGKRTLPCDIERMRTTGKRDDEGNSWFEVKLREGRTQQIRKMFQAIGHPVSKLRRVAIGPISDPKLTPGVWRELTKHEVKMLETMKELKKPAKPRRAASRPASRKKPAAATKRSAASRSTTSRPKPRTATSRSAASRAAPRSSTRRTPSPRPATPRAKGAAGKSTGAKKTPVRRAGARPSRSSARR
ncbi:MAG TPA: pseudouridine synthase [Thermoanaerobaculia bacterium]|jgi:23S rRNA pseudouridine2605 synthase|nr:pseudouridine synthase [Thermoanaerobaculia bacterium]